MKIRFVIIRVWVVRMDKDIVPDLLKAIQEEFEKDRIDSKNIKRLLKLLNDNNETYINANEYAIEIGELLSKVLNKHIRKEILPDGKMYFNIADRILNETLKNNYELIADYAENVQAQLNKKADISLKAKRPQINQDRIDSLVNKLVSKDDFEAVRFILKEPIVNFSQSIVDDAIEVNVDFHAKVGMAPKIVRTAVGKACKWCRKLEGIHDYHSLKNEDVFHRHDNCRCTVDYFPGEGKKQNVWTKQERKIAKNSAQRKKHQFEDIKANNHKSDSAEYKKMIEVLGKDNMPVSVAKFQDMKYNDSEDYKLVNGYMKSVEKGEISPLIGFEYFKAYHNELSKSLVGATLSNGMEIKEVSFHFTARSIGTHNWASPNNSAEIMKRLNHRHVPLNDILECISNGKIKRETTNSILFELPGKCLVSYNPINHKLIQCNPK